MIILEYIGQNLRIIIFSTLVSAHQNLGTIQEEDLDYVTRIFDVELLDIDRPFDYYSLFYLS
ncbi:protein of unknown function [Candidatus Nitrosocosmicus franklandus]|uniref:Uncharacterized protein n=1 Tax=Candidatus Nitrosocosmicus franklandianus TaxID=1798806 RepID=A0A484IAT0_9ARCH|nr:protein of unknown function [Candidatus Nitrosocosmicus franklandus]